MGSNATQPYAPQDIRGLHGRYATGLDPAWVVERVLGAVERADPGIFITLQGRTALRRAVRKLGRFDPIAKPLWGVPFAIKDNIDAAGLPTTAACPGFAYTPKMSATAVERALAAGALLIGKTTSTSLPPGLLASARPTRSPRTSLILRLCRGDRVQGRPSP